MSTKSYGGKAVPDLLTALMSRDRPCELQLAAASALTALHRAGALTPDDPRIMFKTLQCLVSRRGRVLSRTFLVFLMVLNMQSLIS